MKLRYLMIHCTATPDGRLVDKHDIERWHLIENGWSRVGYSDMIHIDGSLENLIPFNQDNIVDDWEVSNGALSFNGVSRHICYVGGKDKDLYHKNTLNQAQLSTLKTYLDYMILRHPDIKIVGHDQVNDTLCPSFDVSLYCKLMGFDENNYLL